MFDKQAIEALQEGEAITSAMRSIEVSLHASLNSVKGCGVAALPVHFTVHDLEKLMPTRRRARGLMTTDVLVSFAAYTLEHAENGATVFVNTDDMSATAVLNLGEPDAPLHADNKALLLSRQTAAYKAMRAIANGQGQKQAAVAEFLEDWAGQVKCFSGSDELSPPKAIAAIRKVTIETMRKLESEEQQLSASMSAFESVKASSKEALPTTIYFTCQPYKGFDERTFVLRLAVLTTGDKPAIGLRVVKQEEHNEDMAKELVDRVSNAMYATQLPTAVLDIKDDDITPVTAELSTQHIPVLIGDYRAGN